ncbi:MFS transporter, partial [Paraburkholderia sp. SIMBA_030]
GFVLAAAVAGGMSTLLAPEQMAAWGWRIPFLLAIPLAIICFIVRSRIEDSPEFEELVATHRVVKTPLREVLRTDFIGVLRVAALAIALTAGGYIGITYMNVYLTGQLGYARRPFCGCSSG